MLTYENRNRCAGSDFLLAPRLLAGILALCLILYVSVHLIFDIRMLRHKNYRTTAVKGPPRPGGGPVIIAFLASFFFWFMFLIGPCLLFFNLYERVFAPFLIQWPFMGLFQLLGVCLTILGVMLANSGRIARGVVAPSWDMPEDYPLATKGAYRLVRHPLYTSYLLMALGLFFLLANGLLLGCFFGLLFQYFIAKREEEILLERFGAQYEEYIQQVGMVFPKFRKNKH